MENERKTTKRKKDTLNSIYTNPNVTREAQRSLAQKLHSEIELERSLDQSYRSREVGESDKGTDTKAFNSFCVEFLDSSKQTKDRIAHILEDAESRLKELEDAKERLEEVERQVYRFEMGLPNEPRDNEAEINRAIEQRKEVIKSQSMIKK